MSSVLNSLPHADGHPASLRPALPHYGARTGSLQCRLFDRILSLHRQVLPPLFRRAHRLHHAQAWRRTCPDSEPAHLRSPRAAEVYPQPRPPAQSRALRLPRIRLQRACGANVSRFVRVGTGTLARVGTAERSSAGFGSRHLTPPPATHTAPPSAAPRSVLPAAPMETPVPTRAP